MWHQILNVQVFHNPRGHHLPFVGSQTPHLSQKQQPITSGDATSPAPAAGDTGERKPYGDMTHLGDNATPAPDTSVKRCQDVTEALILRGSGGKAMVAGIMKAWNLRDVAQLGELTDEDRQAYIDQVAEADAKLETATGGKV